MKKIFLFVFLLCTTATISLSQNIQLHYDFGKARDSRAFDRNYVTSTLEFFKGNKMGSIYCFVDLDFNGKDQSISLSYVQLVQTLKFSANFPLQLYAEYNGGHKTNSDGSGFSFRNMYVLGGHYDLKLCNNITIGTSLGVAYTKDIKNGPDFKFTATWNKPLWNKKILFGGFASVWTEGQDKGKKAVFLAEPQIWYDLGYCKIGSELEISKNYIYNSSKFEFMPTIGLRVDL